jgi:gluconolactonase
LAGAATYESIVSTYMGMALNGPNDVTVRSDGTIYFTDPGSGPLGVEGLYRVAPGTGTAVQLDKGMQFPNGLALSPDEKSLYVAAATSGKVYKFGVNTDGSLGTRSDFAQGLFNCGGLTVDDAGNVYVATPAGVRVLKEDGTPRGSLAVPEVVTNVGFGGPDRKTLFITSPMSVFSVPLQIPGRP